MPSSPATPDTTIVLGLPASSSAVGIEFCTPPTDASRGTDEAPRRYRTVANTLATMQPILDFDYSEECLLSEEEPTSFLEAEKQSCCRKAMLEEMKSIENNSTWCLTNLPPRHKPIGLKWVFKVKRDASGKILKHKARLVAKGYVQQHGVDYDEVFAPVARMETVRLLVAMAAQEGWEIHHMDVKSAFLNGDLEEDVYVVQPPGFVDEEHPDKVLILQKTLYGLKQAPRAWNAKLDESLVSLGFRRSVTEGAVYTRGRGDARLIVGVYVDDLIITGAKVGEISKFKEQMRSLFSMSDLELLTYYLGMEVNQSSEGVTMSQSAYATKILEKARMQGCNSSQVPMENRLKLSKESKGEDIDATQLRSIVGSLRYLLNTRPDLSYSVGYVSRFMEKPTTEHWAAVKHILRYIAGTLNVGVKFKREQGQGSLLVGYSDRDMAGMLMIEKAQPGFYSSLKKI